MRYGQQMHKWTGQGDCSSCERQRFQPLASARLWVQELLTQKQEYHSSSGDWQHLASRRVSISELPLSFYWLTYSLIWKRKIQAGTPPWHLSPTLCKCISKRQKQHKNQQENLSPGSFFATESRWFHCFSKINPLPLWTACPLVSLTIIITFTKSL